jgi:hypothetical protein
MTLLDLIIGIILVILWMAGFYALMFLQGYILESVINFIKHRR